MENPAGKRTEAGTLDFPGQRLELGAIAESEIRFCEKDGAFSDSSSIFIRSDRGFAYSNRYSAYLSLAESGGDGNNDRYAKEKDGMNLARSPR